MNLPISELSRTFSVDFNFHKGGEKDADLPLHFSIRFDEGIFSGKFVYNTFQNGNWSENEQRISNPFKAGQEFDLRVKILENQFKVGLLPSCHCTGAMELS